MLASCLCDIQRNTLSQFVISNVKFLTKLHMSDFDCKFLFKKNQIKTCVLSKSYASLSSIMG